MAQHNHDLQPQDLSAVSPHHETVGLLRQVVKTGRELSGIRLTGNSINGVYVDDAYIYRMT
jgi:hypothetical protein